MPAKWRIDGGGADIDIQVLNNKGVEKVTEYVKKLAGENGIPHKKAIERPAILQTKNYYIGAFKHFIGWLMKEGRKADS